MDLSITLNPDEADYFNTSHTFNIYENTMALNIPQKNVSQSLIQQDSPWQSTLNNLYFDFAHILKNTSGGVDMLEAAADLGKCCSDALAVIQNLKSANTHFNHDEKWLENEQNHWRLLFVLYQDRLKNAPEDDSMGYIGQSEKNCIEKLFKSDNLIREAQLVIDWLEKNAHERDDPILHNSDFTYGWENTLHQLLAPESIAIGSNNNIITQIHPDAPHFENSSLHHLDTANEKKLARRVFCEIRCGNLEQGQQLCYNSGHPWRAVLLEGWKLYHNPYEEEDENDVRSGENEEMGVESQCEDILGNPNRDLWKAASWEYCKQEDLDIYEKASVAAFCGCLETLLKVCDNWEDHLWAYLRTMVDIRVESEVRDTIAKEYDAMPDEYWLQKKSLNEVFSALEASPKSSVQLEAQEIDRIIQKFIIMDEIPKLIQQMEQWASGNDVQTHSLRFFAHLVIFFDNVVQCANHQSCEHILERFILRLSEMNETELIAFYASKLSQTKQIRLYAMHLEKIFDADSRKAALQSAEQNDLNVFEITKLVVESVRNRPSELDSSRGLCKKLTEADEAKISALDWLIFYEEQRLEALKQTNALIFTFLTLGKIDAAQLAINKIPQDSVKQLAEELEQLNEEFNQIIKEYFSYRAYLEAQEAFNEWFRQFSNKPNPPAALPDQAQFTQKVAHQHKVSQYNAELERWNLITGQSAKTAKTLLYNVLLFPDGWLGTNERSDYLRSVCIPEIVMLLYTVLSNSGLHEEALELADLLASEKYGLYKVYSKDKLGEVLEKLCESSVALLNANKDPWGKMAVA